MAQTNETDFSHVAWVQPKNPRPADAPVTDDEYNQAVRKFKRSRRKNGNDCLYTSEDGRHCIAAAILLELGIPVPGPAAPVAPAGSSWSINSRSVDAFMDDSEFRAFWPGLDLLSGRQLRLLDAAQDQADVYREDDPQAQEWWRCLIGKTIR